MKAQFIYEKFDEHTDPIKDMGIGGIEPGKLYHEQVQAAFDEWKKTTVPPRAKLHPLTIEQNAITSFKSLTTLVLAFANTTGPGLFLESDYIIGGCDGTLGRGMMWQGMSFVVTLHNEPDM